MHDNHTGVRDSSDNNQESDKTRMTSKSGSNPAYPWVIQENNKNKLGLKSRNPG